MTDSNTALEVAKEGAKFGTKLLDTLDKFTSPWNKQRLNKADLEADQKKLDMIRNNPDMDIVYVNGEMSARRREHAALAERAEQRELADSVRQQGNLEDILELAAGEGEAEEEVSNKPVDSDWIIRFFSIAKDVNSEEMKIIWAKILAGEIKSPGKFSLRTLECIRNISKAEAAIFQKLLPCVLGQGELSFFSSETEILQKYGISFGDLLVLKETGLINVLSMMKLTISFSENRETYLYGKDCLMKIATPEYGITLELNGYSLSRMGEELRSVLEYSNNTEYMYDLAELIHKSNKNRSIAVTIHDIIERNGETVRYTINPRIRVSGERHD